MAGPTSIRAKRPLALALVALLVVGSFTLAFVLAIQEQRAAERQERALARQVTARLSTALAETIAGLRSAGGIVEPNGDVFPDSFHAYASGVLGQRGILAIALEQVVPAGGRARFENRTRRQIVDLVAPGRFVRAPRRDVYYPVTAVAPDTRQNRGLVGFDIGGDPLRGPAARGARDRGTPQLTPPLSLTTTGDPGFIVVAPLYRLGAPTRTVTERRRALVGFVTAGYEAAELEALAHDGVPEGTRVTVTDGGLPVIGGGPHGDGVVMRIAPGGRSWTIGVERAGTSPYLVPALIVAAGALLAILAWGLFAQARRRERALEDAREEERAARREAVDAERRTASLQALTAALALSRTEHDLIALALERVGASLAPDYALAALVDRARGVLRVTGSTVAAGAEPADADVPLDAPFALCEAVRTGTAVWLASPEEWDGAVPPELAPAVPPRCGCCLPLVGTVEAGGVLVLGAGADWGDADRALAEAMARQVGLALERAHLEEQEHELVATLQRTLLPVELPPVAGLDLAGCYEPAAAGLDIGGDWYDAVELEDGRLALAVGDVVGHGAAAAAVMGQLRSALRAFVLDRGDPAAAFRSLAQFAADPTHATGATAVCVVLDPRTGAFRYARAGHPPPLVVRADGRVDVLDEGRGIPLGVFPDASYVNADGVLTEGDLLVLYSDGAVERRGEPIDAGIARLASLVGAGGRSSREACDTVRATLRAEATVTDDVALVLVRRLGVDSRRVTPPGGA